MATVKWLAPEAIVTSLDNELDALADAATALSAAIDNETDLYTYIDLEVYLAAQGSARAADAVVTVAILPSVDGTNYDAGDQAAALRADVTQVVLGFDAATTARYKTAVNVPIPPLKFKLLFINDTGQALAANSSTLKYRRHNAQVA